MTKQVCSWRGAYPVAGIGSMACALQHTLPLQSDSKGGGVQLHAGGLFQGFGSCCNPVYHLPAYRLFDMYIGWLIACPPGPCCQAQDLGDK
jgi:hypothetical protein